MNKNISQYLFVGLLKTFGVSSLLTFITYKIINATGAHSFEEKQGDFIELFVGIVWTLVLTVSALTVFLNLIKAIRSVPVFSFLSFFFMPIFLSTLYWFLNDSNGEWVSFFLCIIIFLFVLSFLYIGFIKISNSK